MLKPRLHPYLVWYHYESLNCLKNATKPSIVLDLGCGEGLLLQKMDGVGTVCGVDLSKGSLKQAMQADPNKLLVYADAIHLPFRNDAFSAVVSHQLIEHIDDQVSVIREVSRILRPDGQFIITTPLKGALGNLLARSKNSKGEKVLSPDHIHEFKSEQELLDCVAAASEGALNVKQRDRRSVRLPLARLIPGMYAKGFLGPTLPLWLYYYDIYLVLQKVRA